MTIKTPFLLTFKQNVTIQNKQKKCTMKLKCMEKSKKKKNKKINNKKNAKKSKTYQSDQRFACFFFRRQQSKK